MSAVSGAVKPGSSMNEPVKQHGGALVYTADEMEREIELRAQELKLEEAERDVEQAMLLLKERQAQLKAREQCIQQKQQQAGGPQQQQQHCTALAPGNPAETERPHEVAVHQPHMLSGPQQWTPAPQPGATQQHVASSAPVTVQAFMSQQPMADAHQSALVAEAPPPPGGEGAPPTVSMSSHELADHLRGVDALRSIISSAEAAQRDAQMAQERLLDRVGRVEKAVMHPLRVSRLGQPLENYINRTNSMTQVRSGHAAAAPMPMSHPAVGTSNARKEYQTDLQRVWQQQQTWQQRQQFVSDYEPLHPFGSDWDRVHASREATTQDGGPSQPGVMTQVAQAYVRQGLVAPPTRGIFTMDDRTLLERSQQQQEQQVSYQTDPIRARELEKLHLRLETLASAEKDLILLMHEARDAVHYQVGKVASSLENRMEHLLQQVHDIYTSGIEGIVQQRRDIVKKVEILKSDAAMDVFGGDTDENETFVNEIRPTLWELESNTFIALRSKLLVVEGGDVVSSILRRRLRVGAETGAVDALRIVDALMDVVESTAADSVDKTGRCTMTSEQVAAILRTSLLCIEGEGWETQSMSSLREKLFAAAKQRAPMGTEGPSHNAVAAKRDDSVANEARASERDDAQLSPT